MPDAPTIQAFAANLATAFECQMRHLLSASSR